MIVSLFADRRTPDVASIAHELAVALGARLEAANAWNLTPGAPGVAPGAPGTSQTMALYIDSVATRASKGLRFTIEPQPLPASVHQALGNVRPNEHALLAFVGSITEAVITAFDLSTRILILTDSSVTSLRAAQRTFKLCREIGYTPGRVLAVVLLEDGGVVDVDAVRAALKREAFSVVPGGTAPGDARRVAIAELADRIVRAT